MILEEKIEALEGLLEKIEDDESSIDDAIIHYKDALELGKSITEELGQKHNTLTVLKEENNEVTRQLLDLENS